jgi:hypothetical protein
MSLNNIWGYALAAIPGIIIALLVDFLNQYHQRRTQQATQTNARLLLSLEITGNLNALRQFWQDLNALDPDRKTKAEEHLTALADHGLIGFTAPNWSTTRWTRLAPESLPAFTAKETQVADQLYRDLDTISKLFTKLSVLEPDQRKYYEQFNRFWVNRFGEDYAPTLNQLATVVNRVLQSENPLQK